MSDFEKMNDALDAVSIRELPKNPADAVAKFWGRAILANVFNAEEHAQAIINAIPGFVAAFGSELQEALTHNPNVLVGTWGKCVLVVNSKPSHPLDRSARENGIPPEAFPLKSSVYSDGSMSDDGQVIIFGHVGIDGPIEQIWPPVPAQHVTE